MRISYTRDFLLSLSQLDICKKLPTGFESFDQSILSEFDDAFYNVQDRQRISGSLSLQSFRRNEYGSSPPTRGDSSNYSQGILGRWENHSSRRSDKDSGYQSGWDSGKISSQKSNYKPYSKASYAMIPNKNEKLKAPQNQTTSDIFQVLGTVPKPAQTASSSQASTQYVTKAHLMKVQILEPHHFSKSGSPDISKIFSKGKFFIQNNLEKTRKFYEFILVDTDSVEISHIQNKDSTDISYSKCRICKIISLTQWGQSLDTHKMFSQNFKPKSYDYQDYMDAWFYTFLFRPFDHFWFFNWNDKIQNDFPNWFQEWWLFFGAIQDIFCPQILSVYNYFKEHARNLIPTPCWHILFFMSRFSIPWILGSCLGTLFKHS